MFDEIKKHPLALTVSLLSHGALIGLLVFSIDYQSPLPTPEKVQVVQAMVVDESKIQQELQKLAQAEQQKKQQELDSQRKLEQETQKTRELEQKRKDEERRLKALEAQRKQEQEKAKQAEAERKVA